MYISFNEFLYALKINLEKFKDNIKNKPYILYCDKDWYRQGLYRKSNGWISLIILKLLKETNYFLVTSQDRLSKLKAEGYKGDVLMLDDAAYSGTQMERNLSEIKSKIDTSSKIHLILPYMSQYTREAWLFSFYDVCNSGTCDKQVVIYNEIVVKKLLDINKSSLIEAKLLEQYFGFNQSERHPFYFDHKVADNKSTYTRLYNKILKISIGIRPSTFYKMQDDRKKIVPEYGTIWDNIGDGYECVQYNRNKYSEKNWLKPSEKKPECTYNDNGFVE